MLQEGNKSKENERLIHADKTLKNSNLVARFLGIFRNNKAMQKLFLLMGMLLFSAVTFSQVDDETTDDGIILEEIEDDNKVDTSDIDILDIEEDELSRESNFPWERFTVGGSIGNLQFGDITNIGISPEFTYQTTPWMHVGLGGTYEYFKAKRLYNGFGYVRVDGYKYNNLGGRGFLRFTPIKAIFGQLEYEPTSQTTPYAINQNSNPVQVYSVDQKLNNYNAGLGYTSAFGGNGGYYVLFLYNFAHKQNKDDFRQQIADQGQSNPSTYRYPYNAVRIRGGINLPLGGGDKNKKRKRRKKSGDEDS